MRTPQKWPSRVRRHAQISSHSPPSPTRVGPVLRVHTGETPNKVDSSFVNSHSPVTEICKLFNSAQSTGESREQYRNYTIRKISQMIRLRIGVQPHRLILPGSSVVRRGTSDSRFGPRTITPFTVVNYCQKKKKILDWRVTVSSFQYRKLCPVVEFCFV